MVGTRVEKERASSGAEKASMLLNGVGRQAG